MSTPFELNTPTPFDRGIALSNTVTSITATREGGAVRRFHACNPTGLHYDVAQHSWGALNLLLLLHPCPSLVLVKAVQWHDVPERWTGDVPATAKWARPALKEQLEAMEEEVLRHYGLWVGRLLPADAGWLQAVDTLELWMWCREHRDVSRFSQVEKNCANLLDQLNGEGKLPRAVMDFYRATRDTSPVQLPDIIDGLGEAEV